MKHVSAIVYLCLFFPTLAHAYADPGSGQMLWQLGLSFCFGVLFYCKRLTVLVMKFLKRDQ